MISPYLYCWKQNIALGETVQVCTLRVIADQVSVDRALLNLSPNYCYINIRPNHENVTWKG